MAKPISFEKILESLKQLSERIDVSSNNCLEKRYASNDDDEMVFLKHQERKYDHVNDALYDIIAQIESWIQM
jgi:hypothetical protein